MIKVVKQFGFTFFVLGIGINIFMTSCGTGPWFTTRKNFEVFQYPIFSNSVENVQTNGAYIETGEIENPYRSIRFFIFYKNGFCLEGFIDRDCWKKDSLYCITIFVVNSNTEYGVYAVNKNILRIDKFDSTRRLYLRWVENHYAKIVDSTLYFYKNSIAPENYASGPTEHLGYYKYYPLNIIPQYDQTSWYLNKNWFLQDKYFQR